MPYRIAIASCSHPALPQPLWPIISSRKPAAFVWAGDAIYADSFKGLDWKSVGLRRDKDTHKWRFTFPPPSIHEDATPEVIRGWYTKQWEDQIEYRRFVEGRESNGTERPLVFGTIDDHDYGANNGDMTYQFRRESNIEFMDFLYRGVPGEDYDVDTCQAEMSTETASSSSSSYADRSKARENAQSSGNKSRIRSKENDPMYHRALQGKGVYGVNLFDFSRDPKSSSTHQSDISWGSGYWVPEHEAMIDSDFINTNSNVQEPLYSRTYSVAVFVLDVRSNKTPWPQKNKRSTEVSFAPHNATKRNSSTPLYDFLGEDQWSWFKSALSNSQATINIIVSGLQIHPNRFPNDGNIVEEWSKFPESQQLLYNTVLNSGVNSPLFVSGDVHMAQVLRKDCARRSEVLGKNDQDVPSAARSLIEVTTSGLTHSWGTSFSSQPKHHRLPLKLYSYFISPTFMTIAHYVIPWRDLVIKSTEEVDQEKKQGRGGGKAGKQFELGLNFAEFEFDFGHEGEGGNVTVRIFGKEANQVPKLEMRWTFDQLSGKAHTPGMTATFLEFKAADQNSDTTTARDDWICVPYRGMPHPVKIYASNVVMFIVFCALFFLPHVTFVASILAIKRRLLRKPAPINDQQLHGDGK